MKQTILFPVLVIGLMVGQAVTARASASESVQDVMQCMRANVPPTVRVEDIELTTAGPSGDVRTLKGRLFARAEMKPDGGSLIRTMLHIDAPGDLAGAAYLVREASDYLKDGMYVYLPSVKRVRRITGEFADGALLGTNFSYYDFKQLQDAFGDLSGKIEEPTFVNGRAAHVLTFQSRPGVRSAYSFVRAWVDEKTCVPVQVTFYQGVTVLKQLSGPPTSLRQFGKYWYLSEVGMRNAKDGTRTTLRILSVNNDRHLPDRYFNPGSFYLAEKTPRQEPARTTAESVPQKTAELSSKPRT